MLFALPAKFGGLGIINVTEICEREYENSRKVSAESVKNITNQIATNTIDAKKMQSIKNEIKVSKQQHHKAKLADIKSQLDFTMLKLLETILDKSTSNWLTALPLKDQGFHLDKRSFWDALFIRCNIPLNKLPSSCVCGSSFTMDHALIRKRGGVIAIRHNDIRDLTANLLTQVRHDVKVEPMLQPLTGESFVKKSTITDDEARVDVSAICF